MSVLFAGRMHQRAIKTAIWSLTSYLLPLLVSLMAMPFLYRRLGAAEFGVYSLALLTPAIASNLDLGLASASMRRIAGALDSKPDRALGTVLASYGTAIGLVGFLLGIAIVVATPWLAQSLGFARVLGAEGARELLMWCALWAGLTPGLAMPSNLMRAAQRFGTITVVQTTMTLFIWCGAIALVIAGAGVVTVVAFATIVTVVSSLIYIALAWPLIRHVTFQVEFRTVGKDLRFSSGLFLMQLASMVAYQLDRVVISALLSPAAAGNYALCADLANKLVFTVSSLTAFAFPRSAAMAAGGEFSGPSRLLQMLVRNLLPLVIATVVPAMLLAEPFFKLWLGPAYQAEMPQLFRLLWIGFALVSVSVPASHIIIGVGNSSLAAVFSWLTALTSLALLILLLPHVGLVGAGMAAIGAFSTSLPFLWFVHRALRSARDRQISRVIAGCAIGSVAQGLLIWWLAPEVGSWAAFVLAGATALGTFYLTRIALGLITHEESRLLNLVLIRMRV